MNDHTPPVTMKDVAKAAGVAVSTVSYALKNNPKIPAATRERIQTVAKQIGYKPDAYVSTLMARLHNKRLKSEQAVLGLLVEQGIIDLLDIVPYHRDWHQGMHDRANELGYKIDRFIWEPDTLPAKSMVTSLVTRGIRGILVAPYLQGAAKLDFPFENFACASTGVSLRKPELHRVTTDYAYSMELAFEKLLQYGYRRPGLVVPKPFNSHTGSAILGCYLSIQLLNQEVEAIPACLTENYEVDAAEVLPWFRQYRPDVLLVVQPTEVEAIISQEFSIPKEVGLIDLTRDIPERYSGVRQSGYQLGRTIVEMVVNQIHQGVVGVPQSSNTTLIKGEWIEGESLVTR
ncbi:LacI family DNA-binding transcriptional regulator [Cerasicoccus fimbriatus]|uniref:LacI family DNA-binding transcriptional regulator n=1 Tax=Cerasicoccus fimbriatus TaxID=3014554 RepID=UPI0022B5C94B|nr:LacI family DNA-binding transcriptional regulator [Cerasicoccus sp. TK19100]